LHVAWGVVARVAWNAQCACYAACDGRCMLPRVQRVVARLPRVQRMVARLPRTLWWTMDTLHRTSLLSSVDLPAFGAPCTESGQSVRLQCCRTGGTLPLGCNTNVTVAQRSHSCNIYVAVAQPSHGCSIVVHREWSFALTVARLPCGCNVKCSSCTTAATSQRRRDREINVSVECGGHVCATVCVHASSCVCVCVSECARARVCVCVVACVRACLCGYKCASALSCVSVHARVRVRACLRVRACGGVRAWVRMRVCACTGVCVSVCACMCVCARARESERQSVLTMIVSRKLRCSCGGTGGVTATVPCNMQHATDNTQHPPRPFGMMPPFPPYGVPRTARAYRM
jgi:hypothetical protein